MDLAAPRTGASQLLPTNAAFAPSQIIIQQLRIETNSIYENEP